MAVQFNGSSDYASVNLDLSAGNVITVSCWIWDDSYTPSNDQLAFEFTANWNTNAGGLFNDPNDSGVAQWSTGISDGGGGHKWFDHFTRPSAAAWHHFMFVYDRGTPQNLVWVDGTSQSLTTALHNAASYGNFANSTLYLMSRGGASLFLAGRMTELVVWTSALNNTQAGQLAAGVVPTTVQASPLMYVLRRTASDLTTAAVDGSGNGHNLTINGGTFVANPAAIAVKAIVPSQVNSKVTVSGTIVRKARVTPSAVSSKVTVTAALKQKKAVTLKRARLSIAGLLRTADVVRSKVTVGVSGVVRKRVLVASVVNSKVTVSGLVTRKARVTPSTVSSRVTVGGIVNVMGHKAIIPTSVNSRLSVIAVVSKSGTSSGGGPTQVRGGRGMGSFGAMRELEASKN